MTGAAENRTTLDDDWRGLVVFCAGSSWDGNRGTDRHLVERLVEHVPVLWVDPPVSLLTQLRQPNRRADFQGPRLRVIAPGLVRLTPLAPPGVSRPGLRELVRRATRRAMAAAVARLGSDVDAVVVASLDGLFGACGERKRVLYATDDLVAAGALMGLSERWLARQERARRREVDLVIAVSEPLVDRWRTSTCPAVLVPNGCDVAAYRLVDIVPPAEDITLPSPIVGFVGQLSHRLDLDVLRAVAATGVSLLLVGPRQPTFPLAELAPLLARPNVQWVGPKPFNELPRYLRCIDVGITPYTDSAFNRHSFPLKTLEYLACGRAAVATDLPATRWLNTDLVRVASEPAAFATATLAALAERDPALPERRRTFAVAHSWERRAADFAQALRSTHPDTSSR